MKKKVLTVLLAMSVMATVFTGCNLPASQEKDVEVSEESKEEKESEEKESEEKESEEKKSEASSEEKSSEASSEEKSSEASSEEKSSEASSEEKSSEANAATGEWATAYDTYFDEHEILRDNAQMEAVLEEEGLTMTTTIAVSGETSLMTYDFNGSGITIYVTEDKMYAHSYMAGEEAWMFAPVESEEDADAVMDTSIDSNNIDSWTYKEEVTEDGVTYDVLEVQSTDDEGETAVMDCYVNRETQEIDKYAMTEDGTTMVFVVTDIDGIELPAEAANATEATADDIAGTIVIVMLAAAMGGSAPQ